jgi:biopolymer transport protein ExbD
MALVKRTKKKQDRPELQMAPMIDCVFLLLIFFMVTSILKVPPPFNVAMAESTTRHDFPYKKFNVYVSADGRLAVDDQEMQSLDDLELFLAAHEHQISTLIIKADRRAKHGIVIDIMERAKRRFSKPEGQEIALAVSSLGE